jgi:hypothetical protein
MKACEYPLEIEESPLYLFYATLGLNTITTVPILYFLTLLAVKTDLTSVSRLSFPGFVGRAKHHHLPWCFISIWLFLFYRCGWTVGIKILLVGIKSFSFHQMTSPAPYICLVLSPWPHSFYVGHSHLSLDLVIWSKLPFFDWTNILCDGFHLSFSFWSRSSSLPYRLASPCDCWVIIAKAYQVVHCLIISWSLIILPSLKPMANFVGSVSSLRGMPLCRSSSMTSPSQPLHWWVHLACPWTQPLFALRDCPSLKTSCREQVSSWCPCELCLTPCVVNSTVGSFLTGW